ncbi:hypothetical protein, partial [Propionibacterium freudenreichii]|uniref:hypothetical protein n=1 Tax=Propionibacterium freudenreichii TaxID=1744 RepID=UPI0021A27570
NDNPTRAIRTLHRSDPRRPGVLLRRYDTTGIVVHIKLRYAVRRIGDIGGRGDAHWESLALMN